MAGDMLHRGARMLERVRSANMAHAVEYVPAGGEAIEISATTDAIDPEQLGEISLAEIRRARAFLVAAEDLPSRPAVGDLIRETIDGTTVEYEVTTYGGEPCWSYDDVLNKRYRVHTRRVTA